MKVKPVEYKGEKLVKFWCPGCGEFHLFPQSDWNGDVDNPSMMSGQHRFIRQDRKCTVHMVIGVLRYGDTCTHRLAGKDVPMQHEEAWKDDWLKGDGCEPVPPKV